MSVYTTTEENLAIKLFIIFYDYDFSLGIIHLKCGLVALHDKIRVIRILVGIKITFDVLFRCPIPDIVRAGVCVCAYETIDYCNLFKRLKSDLLHS